MALLPTVATDRRLRVITWLNLLGNLLIIGTGGAVRLTESGLGCPTWPTCTADSLVNTPEMGIHGVIEFGNRLLSPVLGILALLLVLAAWRIGGVVRALALVVLLGVIAQAIVGGITVLTQLNAWIVGFHYVASVALVAVATALLMRTRARAQGPRERFLPRAGRILLHASSALLAAVIVFGVLTTGAGPHSGDADAVRRNGLVWDVLAHVHAWVAYALVAALLGLLVVAIRAADRRLLSAVGAVGGIVVVQIVVGIAQSNLGLPPVLVGVHMVLAGITAALTVVLIDAGRRPVAAA